jgi:hypothetical protein
MGNVADMVHEYFTSEHRDDELLVTHADRLGNHAVFKRLGFVLEHLGVEAPRWSRRLRRGRIRGCQPLSPSTIDGRDATASS